MGNSALCSVLCADLERWNGGEVGGKSKRGDIGIHMANSLHCTAKTNTTL